MLNVRLHPCSHKHQSVHKDRCRCWSPFLPPPIPDSSPAREPPTANEKVDRKGSSCAERTLYTLNCTQYSRAQYSCTQYSCAQYSCTVGAAPACVQQLRHQAGSQAGAGWWQWQWQGQWQW